MGNEEFKGTMPVFPVQGNPSKEELSKKIYLKIFLFMIVGRKERYLLENTDKVYQC